MANTRLVCEMLTAGVSMGLSAITGTRGRLGVSAYIRPSTQTSKLRLSVVECERSARYGRF